MYNYYIIGISRICVGSGMISSVLHTMPTMLYGLDILYPKPYNFDLYDEINNFTHLFPYMLTGTIGCVLIGVGMSDIIPKNY